MLSDFAPVVVDATVADGEVVRLGDLALTAHATPGHTTGSTTWTWRTCEAKDRCLDLVYADSLTAVSRDDYRFSEHPEVVARFRSAFDAIERLPCDVLITPHPGASNLFDRIAARAPLRDSRACAEYASGARKRLEGRLAREVGAAQAP